MRRKSLQEYAHPMDLLREIRRGRKYTPKREPGEDYRFAERAFRKTTRGLTLSEIARTTLGEGAFRPRLPGGSWLRADRKTLLAARDLPMALDVDAFAMQRLAMASKRSRLRALRRWKAWSAWLGSEKWPDGNWRKCAGRSRGADRHRCQTDARFTLPPAESSAAPAGLTIAQKSSNNADTTAGASFPPYGHLLAVFAYPLAEFRGLPGSIGEAHEKEYQRELAQLLERTKP